MKINGLMRTIYYFLFTLLLFSCKDDQPIEQEAPLVVSDTEVTLSPKKPYAEITIKKGAGNYIVSSSDESVAQYVLIDKKLYITGYNIGNAIITLTDQDKNQVKIKVTINELIAREMQLFSLVFVKIGDTKTITSTDPNPLYNLVDTASVISIGGTANTVQVTAQKKGFAYLYYLKEYWPTLVYNIQVVDHYLFTVSPTTNNLLLSVGANSKYYIYSGCGNYALSISNTNVISAELLAWPNEQNLSQDNPRVVQINALQKGTSELNISNVETDDVKTVTVTVR